MSFSENSGALFNLKEWLKGEILTKIKLFDSDNNEYEKNNPVPVKNTGTMYHLADYFDKYNWVIYPKVVLKKGDDGEWDDDTVEWPAIMRDTTNFAMAYHGKSTDTDYEIGVAISNNALGPWIKSDNNPVLTADADSWDSKRLAHPTMFYDSVNDKYVMFYFGDDDSGKIQMGYATADSVEGSWTKGDSILIAGSKGWGGKVHFDGENYYCLVPVSQGMDVPGDPELWKSQGLDYEQPWENLGCAYTSNLFSSELIRDIVPINGIYYGFGTQRIINNEGRHQSISLYYSEDMTNWKRVSKNPIISDYEPSIQPNHYNYEHPLLLWHDQKPIMYVRKRGGVDGSNIIAFVGLETAKNTSIAVPDYFSVSSINSSEEYYIENDGSYALDTRKINRISLSLEVTYDSNSTNGVLIEIETSNTGLDGDFDNIPLYSFEPEFIAGENIKQSFEFDVNNSYARIKIINQDESYSVTDVSLKVNMKQ